MGFGERCFWLGFGKEKTMFLRKLLVALLGFFVSFSAHAGPTYCSVSQVPGSEVSTPEGACGKWFTERAAADAIANPNIVYVSWRVKNYVHFNNDPSQYGEGVCETTHWLHSQEPNANLFTFDNVFDCLCMPFGPGANTGCPAAEPPPPPPPPSCNSSLTCCQSGTSTTGPIFPATGEKSKFQTDFTDSAPHPLDFSRTYRTAWGNVTPAAGMGTNWNHRFGMQLVIVGSTGTSTVSNKSLQLPDGSQRRFTHTGTTAAWVNTDGTDQLIENATGTLYTSAQNDDVWLFNALGKPVTLTQRNGWAYTLAYNASNQLATVTNKFGRTLALTYGATGTATAGLLIGVATPDGQRISYQ